MSTLVKCDLCEGRASPYAGAGEHEDVQTRLARPYGRFSVTVRHRWFHGLPFGVVKRKLDICWRCMARLVDPESTVQIIASDTGEKLGKPEPL